MLRVPGAACRVNIVQYRSSTYVSRCGQAVAFYYQRQVNVCSITPSRGVAEGGTPVTVLGSGFSAGAEAAGALLCRWNASVTPAAYASESEVVCISPQTAPGWAEVRHKYAIPAPYRSHIRRT